MDRTERWLFAAVLIASSLVYAASIPQWLSSILIVGAHAAFTIYVFVGPSPLLAVVTRPYILATLGVVWVLYLVSTIAFVDIRSFPGTLAAIATSMIGVILIPQIVDREFFFKATSRMAAVVVVLGLPAFIFGPFSILGLDFGVGPAPDNFFGGLVQARPLRSYYVNQNFLSVLVLCGAVASYHDVRAGRSVGWILITINTLGLWLAHSRLAMVAALVGAGLFATYQYRGIPAVRKLVVGGAACGVVVAMLAVFLPTVRALLALIIPVRIPTWGAVIEAASHRLWFGYGLVDPKPIFGPYLRDGVPLKPPHNSFLRVLLVAGLGSAFAYLSFVGVTIATHLRVLAERDTIVLFVMTVVLTLALFSQNFTMFDLNSSALLASVTFGFAVREPLYTDTVAKMVIPLPNLRQKAISAVSYRDQR